MFRSHLRRILNHDIIFQYLIKVLPFYMINWYLLLSQDYIRNNLGSFRRGCAMEIHKYKYRLSCIYLFLVHEHQKVIRLLNVFFHCLFTAQTCYLLNLITPTLFIWAWVVIWWPTRTRANLLFDVSTSK